MPEPTLFFKLYISTELLQEASHFIATLEHRQGLKIACPEEIAFTKKWIDRAQLEKLAAPMLKNGYGRYLIQVLKDAQL